MDLPKIHATKMLIVDENVLFREGLTAMLDRQPDFAVVGQTGLVDEALVEAIELEPDVILMDVHFSVGSGIDAIRPIHAKLPRTKIVMLTMLESDEHLFSAMLCGANGFLLKNIPFSDLLASLRALARGEAAISRTHMTRVLDKLPQLKMNGYGNGSASSSALTAREMEVIQELELGSSNREIAEHLTIAENTVKRHIHSILRKLGLRSRREVVKYVRKERL